MIFGPRQVVARISQDQTIAPQITLWNQQGSQVIWGTLMVIPIEESLIYVRPLYLRASGGRIPELTRVIVAYQNQIVMEETLDAALVRLFGGTAAVPGADLSLTRGQVPSGAESAQPAEYASHRRDRRPAHRPRDRRAGALRPCDRSTACGRLDEIRRGTAAAWARFSSR